MKGGGEIQENNYAGKAHSFLSGIKLEHSKP
jgi:hypothetical protein